MKDLLFLDTNLLVTFSLACAGCTFIITRLYIFQWLRHLLKRISPNYLGILIYCPACTGFWVGTILYLSTQIFVNQIQAIHYQLYIVTFLYSCVSSVVSFFSVCHLQKFLPKPKNFKR
jgi:hypothetical protein